MIQTNRGKKTIEKLHQKRYNVIKIVGRYKSVKKENMDIYERIGIVCGRIPEGKVATYGQIALLCKKPGNSRQVGYALKHGLAGESGKAAAHRVVNSKGILSGAASFETFDRQKLLLEQEGVEVVWTAKGWQVDIKKFGWKNTMAEALILEKSFENPDFSVDNIEESGKM